MDHAQLPARTALTTTEFAGLLGVPESTVRGWVRRGVIPSFKIGGRRLIRTQDLLALTGQDEQPLAGTPPTP